ncbi:MAG: hypothetical protein CME31_02785 [Gimesia sp.]|jgi:hypothetical protein|nr:hypothetical protein [Gimesia sp.]|tara:strand:- start:2610 stop:2840 length:231 start_codon:yes stop_codon:yes gene_type:complete
MAKEIKELSSFSREDQERILSALTDQDYIPIEIDGNVYMIPGEVNDLIDNLVLQLYDLRELFHKGKKEVGKEGYKG